MPQLPYTEIIERAEQLTTLLKEYLQEYFPNKRFENEIDKIILNNPSLEKIQAARNNFIDHELKKRHITITLWRISLTYLILARQSFENKKPRENINEFLNNADFYLEQQREEIFRVDRLKDQDTFKKEMLPKFGSNAKTKRYELIKQKARELLLEKEPPRQWQYATDAARSIKEQIIKFDASLSEEANRPYLEKVPYTTSTKMQLKETNIIRLISKYINQDEDLKQQIIKSRIRK